MNRKAKLFSEDEKELLRLLKKRGARSEGMGVEEEWVVDREEGGYDF